MRGDETCRFTVGIEGRWCGRKGRVALMRIEHDAEGAIAFPYRDVKGDPHLYCAEHWDLMQNPLALRDHRIEQARKARAARAGRRNGQRKLASRYERQGL